MMRIEIHFLSSNEPDTEIIYKVDDYFVKDGVLYIKTKHDVFDDLEEAQITECYPIQNLKKWRPMT